MGKRKVGEGSSDIVAVGSKSSGSSGIIEAANALNEEEFEDAYWDSEKYGAIGEHHVELFSVECSLTKEQLQACFDLIEKTSRHDYEPSSFGWHPKRKMREMKEKEMRYILIGDEDLVDINGFLSFMLTHDSVPAVPVLYVYEVHLDSSTRGQGIGKAMMEITEDIARKVGVEKVMLTCFKSNEKARGFYEGLGYAVDVSSPEDRTTRKKVVKTDYVIMSKEVSHSTEGILKKEKRNTSASATGQTVTQVSQGSISKAASCLAKLPDSYILEPELRAWIEDDCTPLLDKDQLISVLSEASRLLGTGCIYGTKGLNYARVLTALYVGLQERFNSARDTQFKAWSALLSLHRDFQEYGIYSYAKEIQPIGYTDIMSRYAKSKGAPPPTLVGYLDEMPPSMYKQLFADFKGIDSDLAQRETEQYEREEELDRREDDLYAREMALQEATARHDRARLNIRARAKALKQREMRFAAREVRERDKMAQEVAEMKWLQKQLVPFHREMDEGLGEKLTALRTLQGLPDNAHKAKVCKGIDESGVVEHLRDYHGFEQPDENEPEEKDESEGEEEPEEDSDAERSDIPDPDWRCPKCGKTMSGRNIFERVEKHHRDVHGTAAPIMFVSDGEDENDEDENEEDEDQDDDYEQKRGGIMQAAAAARRDTHSINREVLNWDADFMQPVNVSKTTLQEIPGNGAGRLNKKAGNKFELPKPEALRGVKVDGNNVETWLRRSGSVRESFGKGEPF